MDRNQQAASYLALLAPDQLPQAEGLAFRSQLQRVGFDYSLASLQQVDEMLMALRSSMKMEYAAFLEKQPAVNFVAALNFYLGTTVARVGQFALKWVDHGQAAQFMPNLPQRLETDLGCVMGNNLLFPANIVTEMLFDPNQQRTCSNFAQATIQRLTSEGQRMPDPVARPNLQAPGVLTGLLADALGGAGFLGAWGMAELAQGAQVTPLALVPNGAQRTLIDFSTFGPKTLDEAIQMGLQRLATNPDGGQWQALYYDGFVHLPTGRRDALVVELRVYEPSIDVATKTGLGALFQRKQAPAPVRNALALTMALPYRPASDALGFANFAPRLVDCSYQGAELVAMLDAFYRGIYSAKHFGWEQRLIDA